MLAEKSGAGYSTRFVKSKVYGVGVDDTDYKKECRVVKGGRSTIIWYCEIFSRWKNMLRRCYTNGDPCYSDVVVCDDWLYFSNYKNWFDGLDKPPYEFDVDKDILQGISRVYSPETCLLLPRRINSFLGINSKNVPGSYFEKSRGLYQAYCTDVDGKRKNLGRYKTELEAHKRWQEFKIVQIDELAKIYKDDTYLDPRVIPILKDIADKINDDLLNDRVTKNLKVFGND